MITICELNNGTVNGRNITEEQNRERINQGNRNYLPRDMKTYVIDILNVHL